MIAKWIFRHFVGVFCIGSYVLWFCSDEHYYSEIYYWSSAVDNAKLTKEISKYSSDSICFEPIEKVSNAKEKYWRSNDFFPTKQIFYSVSIDNNRIKVVTYTDSIKTLTVLYTYQYGINGIPSRFFLNKELKQTLEIARQFEDSVLRNIKNVEKNRWRIYRNIYTNFFFDNQLYFYLAFFIIDRIICWIIKKKQNNHDRHHTMPDI